MLTTEEKEKIDLIMAQVIALDDIYVNLELIRRLEFLTGDRQLGCIYVWRDSGDWCDETEQKDFIAHYGDDYIKITIQADQTAAGAFAAYCRRCITVFDHFDVPMDLESEDGKDTVKRMLHYERTGELL